MIAPGKTYTDTLEVFGGTPGKQVYPELEVREVEGEYRLVWTQLHRGFDPERYPQGDTLPLDSKVSNPFTGGSHAAFHPPGNRRPGGNLLARWRLEDPHPSLTDQPINGILCTR